MSPTIATLLEKICLRSERLRYVRLSSSYCSTIRISSVSVSHVTYNTFFNHELQSIVQKLMKSTVNTKQNAILKNINVLCSERTGKPGVSKQDIFVRDV